MAVGGHATISAEYNLLLLGESGSGKSTFINAFNYYASIDRLEAACIEASQHSVLIPFQFAFNDKDNVEHTVTVEGRSDKDDVKSGDEHCKSYPFQFLDCKVRLIDTTSVEATSGVRTTEIDVQHVLQFIERFKALNAIGIVIRADQKSPKTEEFKCFMKRLLTNLDKGAASNFLFIFTSSGNCNYQPGPAKKSFERFLKEIYVGKTIKKSFINTANIFCFDNNWLKFVCAYKQGLDYIPEDAMVYQKAFLESKKEYRRLMHYVQGLRPLDVDSILSVNNAKRYVNIINPILDDILQHIQENKRKIGEQERNVVRAVLHQPFSRQIVDYRIGSINDNAGRTPDTDNEDILAQRNDQSCCTCCIGCCVLTIVGAFCALMELVSGLCGCHHRRTFSRTDVNYEIIEGANGDEDQQDRNYRTLAAESLEVLDDFGDDRWNGNNREIGGAEGETVADLMQEPLETQLHELNDEASIIQNALPIFIKFLQSNAIIPPGTDVLEVCKNMEDEERINETAAYKRIVDAVKSVKGMYDVTPADLQEVITQLHNMELYGPKIQQIIYHMQDSTFREHAVQEFLIQIPKSLSAMNVDI